MTADQAWARHRGADDPPPLTVVPARPPSAAGPDLALLGRARIDLLLRQQQLVMVTINTIAGCALLLNAPGTSPAMRFIALVGLPLPLWGVAWLAVPALLVAGMFFRSVQHRAHAMAHAVALLLWGFTGTGSVIGLVTLSTPSPSASLLLSGLIVGMGGWHAVALLFRRRMARA